MATDRRELVIQAIKTRLEAIIGDGSYHRGQRLKSVQRYIHEWRHDGLEVNRRNEETIIIRPLFESGSPGAIGEVISILKVDLEWVLLGDTANDADINDLIADFKRSLFLDSPDLGGFARSITWDNRLVEPETNIATSGVHFVLNITYGETLGDPTSGE